MSFAILKLSYNNPGESSLVGGICGSGFFIEESVGITANHVLNNNTLEPNAGYTHCQAWILTRNNIIYPIEKDMLYTIPDIDTTVINLKEKIPDSEVYLTSGSPIHKDLLISSFGYIGSQMPVLNASWKNESLFISDAKLDSVCCDQSGKIMGIKTMTVNAVDVKMENINGFEVSFISRVGMSGGPVLTQENNEIVGMLSFGLPSDADVKTSTFAVNIEEITNRIP